MKELFEGERITRSFRKGEYVFQQGSPAKELFLLLHGKVQIGKLIPDGRELSLRICGKDDILAEFAFFDQDTSYLSNAKVLEDAEVLVITKEYMEEQLSAHPSRMVKWFQHSQIEHLKTQSKLRDLILHGKKGAVYSTLIRLCNTFGKQTADGITLDISLTNQEVASLCGTSREVVNRMLSELKKENVVVTKDSQLIIQNLDYLKEAIDCDNCPIEICQID
ncbi:CRP/FNR family transcriptional regulator [Bacillus ectoiniformans]|nr:CRP/FNR family transcriptional regulator [Bacillus ectoiniformans]